MSKWNMSKGKRATAAAVLALMLGLGVTPALAQQSGAQTQATQLAELGKRPDELFKQGKYAEALAAAEEFAKATEQVEAAWGNPGSDTATALNSVIWHALFAKRFERALEAGDRAAALASSYSDQAYLPIQGNRAHALMFLGRAREALAAYVEHKGAVMASSQKWEDALFEDFAEFQKHGLDHPVMAQVKEALAAAPEAPESPRSLWRKSMELLGADKKPETISMLEKYVEAVKASRGENSPDYAEALRTLGQILEQEQRSQEAEPLLRQALALDEKYFPPQHPRLAEDLKALAYHFTNTNHADDAEKLYRQALSITEKRYGPEHPNDAEILSDLASLSANANRLTDAEALYRRALAITEKHYGSDNKLTASRLSSLGMFLKQVGKFGESESMLKRALEIKEKTYGPEHPYVAVSLGALASLYKDADRLAEAEPVMRRVLAINEKNFGHEHSDVATSLKSLGSLLKDAGRYVEAEPMLRKALVIFEKRYGSESSVVSASLNNLALLLEETNRLAEAETMLRRAMAIDEKLYGVDGRDRAPGLNNLATLLQMTNRLAEAEALYRKTLAIEEKSYGPESSQTASSLDNLAGILDETNRSAEGEQLKRRALAIVEKIHGPDSIKVARQLNNWAYSMQLAGRFAEAEPLFRRSLTIVEKKFGHEHPIVTTFIGNVGYVLMETNRLAEAEPLLREALARSEKTYGPDHPDVALKIVNLSALLQDTNRAAEAEPLLLRALAIDEKGYGSDHPSVARDLKHLARAHVRRGDWPGALQNVRRSTAIAIASAQRMRGQSGAEKRQLTLSIDQFKEHAAIAFQAAHGDALVRDEAFALAQRVAANEASGALAQASARFVSGNDALAALARKQQDLARLNESLDKRLLAAVGAADKAAAEAARAEQAKVGDRLNEIAAQLAKEHPDYVTLINPAPLTVAETQALLAPDEAFVQFLDVAVKPHSPISETAFAFVITKNEARWIELPLGAKALGDQTAALRCGLDSEAWKGEANRCGELLGGQTSNNDLPPFDLARAHGLYRDLFGQAEDAVKDKRLLIAPSGALTRLPFQVLVTDAPDPALKGSDAYAKAHWLGTRNAISVLPSAASLRALRLGKQGSASDPFIGFGNPLLNGGHGDRSAWDRQNCQQTAAIQSGRRGPGRGLAPALAQVYRGAFADVDTLRRAEPLPDTADELCAVAHNLGVPDSTVYLGERATVSQIKALSASGALGRARAIHFATHGLMAGETALFLRNQAEPALLMTPPASDKASVEDDGLLKASDVTQLKLNADWVVMSACNTAAGGEGGEALSGLARAFFYAGARSMLVSHWYVDSSAAVEITTGAFAALKADPGIGRDEALRRSLKTLIAKGGDNAHPSVWAPFVLVGDSGRTASISTKQASAPSELVLHYAGPGKLAAISSSGRRAVAPTQDGGVTIWNLETGKPAHKLIGSAAQGKSFSLSADGRLLAAAAPDGASVGLWDADNGQSRGSITAGAGRKFSREVVVLSPDGRWLAAEQYGAGEHGASVGVWDAVAGRLARMLEVRFDDVRTLAFSGDNGRLAVSDSKGSLRVFDVKTGKAEFSAKLRPADVRLVALSPDGRLLAAAGANSEIKLWDAAAGKQLDSVAARAGAIAALAFTPDGQLLVAGGDGAVELRETPASAVDHQFGAR